MAVFFYVKVEVAVSIAAELSGTHIVEVAVHELRRDAVAVINFNGIDFGLPIEEKTGVVVDNTLQFEGKNVLHTLLRNPFGGDNEHIVKKMRKMTAAPFPAYALLFAGLLIAVAVGVANGNVVIKACFAGVVGFGLRVKSPKWHIHAVQYAELRCLCEFGRVKPALANPFFELSFSRFLATIKGMIPIG